VEKIMNPIKVDYPFIDLLKPETDAAIPLLLALEPSVAGITNAIEFDRLRRLQSTHRLATPTRPSQAGDIAGRGETGAQFGSLRQSISQRMSASEVNELFALIAEASQARAQEQGNISSSVGGRILSFLRLRFEGSHGQRLRILLTALRALQHDHSFDRNDESEQAYASAAKDLAGEGFSTIIFGHTHLAKEVAIKENAKYINTGTWADVMRVPDAIVNGSLDDSLHHLKKFADAVRAQRLDDYVAFQPTFAHVQLDAADRTLSASLQDFERGKVRAT